MTQGQHFLQIPGPSPVPERIQRAIDRQVIDHRGPEFQKLGHQVLADIKPLFGTTQPVIIYPASGTGAWEAAIVNTCRCDRVLMAETGQFATLWQKLASRWGVTVDSCRRLGGMAWTLPPSQPSWRKTNRTPSRR